MMVMEFFVLWTPFYELNFLSEEKKTVQQPVLPFIYLRFQREKMIM